MTKIITVAMSKGGVGKSTSAVTIAHRLAMMDFTVLLVDFGPQGSTSTLLGFDPVPGISDLIDNLNRHTFNNVLRDTGRSNLYQIPSNSYLRRTERYLIETKEPIQRVAQDLRGLFASYDIVVIDTHPGYWFQELALLMADILLLTTSLEFLSLTEIRETISTAQAVSANPECQIVLPTMERSGTVESRENLDLLRENFSNEIAVPIPNVEAVRRSVAEGQTIWEYPLASRSKAAEAYQMLVDMWLFPRLQASV